MGPSRWRRVWHVGLPFLALAAALALIWQVSVAALFGAGVPVSGMPVEDSSSPSARRERLPRAYRGLTNPLDPTPEHVTAGADLYRQHCAFCHGDDGRALTPAARGMQPQPEAFTGPRATPMSDAKMFYRMTEGEARTGMPGWKGVLSETERWQIILHIRQLQQSPTG